MRRSLPIEPDRGNGTSVDPNRLDREPEPLTFSREGMRRVDAEATGVLGIPGLLLMERAALGLARETLALARTLGSIDRFACVCGPGGNGGDGWAAARHLHGAGADVLIVDVQSPAHGTDAATNRAVARSMGLAETTLRDWHPGRDVVIDAVLGTGGSRPPEGPILDAIAAILAAREQGCRVIAADLPSGLDADSGGAPGIAVEADLTVTFAGIKRGLLAPEAQRHVGRLVVVPIGVPRELLKRHAEAGR